jgi:pimeloyl-[acyl-carrier protein] methyl ester esterase
MSQMEGALSPKHLVLLPGLDGTGELFADFLRVLPSSLNTTVVSYPTNIFLLYSELLQLVRDAVPKTEPFVVLAESFSTPLAFKYAATNPANLAAVVICAGFARNPLVGWSGFVKAVAQPWFFRLMPPQFVLEYFLVGQNAPPLLIQKLRQTLKLVHPEVLSSRVRDVMDCDARNELARITVPVMALAALHDRLLSPSCRKEILQVRPDIGFVTVEGPHMLLQREPQKVANLVVPFIATC